jgi:hypothetical protein
VARAVKTREPARTLRRARFKPFGFMSTRA